MAAMRRTLKVIYLASQLCGISPYGSFLRNDVYENPVLCKKYLFYIFVLLIAISVAQLHLVFRLFTESTNVSSDAHSVSIQIHLIFLFCFFITYMVTAITRLIGVRNFFKISRKLLSVGSFVNYHEGTIFSNAVIALHVVLFVTYLFGYSIQWFGSNYKIDMLHFFVSGLICDTVTNFASVQFLYFVFTLRRHFTLLNSSLNEVVMSTVKSDNTLSIKICKMSVFSAERYSVISGLRDILYRHLMLCDILELINTSYSLQVLEFVGSKFGYATIFLYILFFFDIRSFLISDSFLCYTRNLCHLRNNAACYSGVLLQVCQFSGRCYVKT
jgi:hypothetical protein